MNTINKIATRLILSAAAMAITATAALSAPITIPAGLNPGDTYRLAFVTSTTTDATSPNIADYNNFVTAAANSQTELAALGTTWMAIASTPSSPFITGVDARNNTGTNPFNDGVGVPIYLLDATKIADNNADLWDGSIAAPLNVTESGGANANSLVFTGSDSAGIGSSGFQLGNAFVFYGATGATNSHWIHSDNPLFNGGALEHLYALSGILTVAPAAQVPEPGALGVLALGLVGVTVMRRRKFAA